jgi:ABC-type uncharacterized transport system substrate-binding protein
MSKQDKLTGIIISFLLIVYFSSVSIYGQSSKNNETINIAVVRDGPTFDVKITELIQPELLHLLGEDYSFNFVESSEFNAQWNPSNFRTVVENALSDETVDIILGVGALVTQEAASDELVLSKPFVSTTLLTGDVPPLPFSIEDYSLKENLTLVILPTNRDKDFEVFNKLIHFDTVYFGLPIEDLSYLQNISLKIDNFSKEIGITIIPVPISNNIKKTIAEIPVESQAFYFQRTPRLTNTERKELIDSLISRKIPVFSGQGLEDIELGVFATNKSNMNLEVSRRSAINLFRLIRGEKGTDLPVFLISDFKLRINGKSAAKIGYYPDYDTRITATILYREYLEGDVREINLKSALKSFLN